jgi:hypothetical protein
LENAVAKVQYIEGFTCEFGVRQGGSTFLIMETLHTTNQSKIHIAIDPFGNIDYKHWEDKVEKLDKVRLYKYNEE